jgi:MFS family permease
VNATLQNRRFLFLFLGRLISSLGDWILDVTLPVWMYQITGSGVALGAVIILQTLPQILLSPIAGLVADRVERRLLVIVLNLLFALSTASLLFVTEERGVFLIYAVATANAVIGTFLSPAQSAIIPMIVSKEDRQNANSLLGLVGAIMMVVGPLTGGLLFALIGPNATVTIDVVTFLVAATSICLMGKLPEQTFSPITPSESKWDRIIGGWRVAWQEPTLRTLIYTWGVMMTASGVVMTVLVIFARDVLQGGDSGYGYIRAAQGAGMFIGGVLIQVVGKRVLPNQWFRGGMLAFGPLFILGTLAPSLPIAALCVAAMGSAMVVVAISNQTLMQNLTQNEFRGRVSSTFDAVSNTAILIGATIGGLVVTTMGARNVMLGAAIIATVATIIPLIQPLTMPNSDTEKSVEETQVENVPVS